MRPRSVLAAAVAAGILSAVAIAGLPSAAIASTAQTYFGSNAAGDLLKVTLNGGKVTNTAVLEKHTKTLAYTPMASDGDWIAGQITDSASSGGGTPLFTYDRATKTLHNLSAKVPNMTAAALYDSGKKVVFSTQSGSSYVISSMPSAGGAITKLYSSKNWSSWDIAMSEGGKHLYMAATNQNQVGNVFEITSSGLTKLESNVSLPKIYGSIEISPDGSKLAVEEKALFGPGGSTLSYVTLSSGTVHKVKTLSSTEAYSVAWSADQSDLVFGTPNAWKDVTLGGTVSTIGSSGNVFSPVLAG
jgi:hypothetical protein